MNPKYFRARLFDDLAGAAGGGGAAAAPAAAPLPDPGAPHPGHAITQPGALAPADAKNPSALAAGQEWTPQSIPEKYRVAGADGQLDLTASLRKVDEHRAALEKRMGAGDIRPKTPEEYKLPETEAFKALPLDPSTAKQFQAEAHEAGLSQSQYEFVMSKYASLAPALVQAGQQESVDGAVAALKDTWKGDYDANIRESFRVVSKVAESAGIPFDEVEKAIGNNPVAIRLFAALAPEMREDATPSAAGSSPGLGSQTYEDFIAANWEAYQNRAHPQHKAITERANQIAAKATQNR